MCLKELGFGTIAYSSALFNTSSNNKYEGKSNISILNNYFILNIPCQKLGKYFLFPFNKKHSLKKKCFLFLPILCMSIEMEESHVSSYIYISSWMSPTFSRAYFYKACVRDGHLRVKSLLWIIATLA
jgi:hypothetical protein